MRRTAFWLATAGVSALATSAFAQSAAVTGTEANELEAVVVTAAPFAVSADALTVNVEVIDRDQLDVAPAQGLGDLLSGIPGLRSTFFGPGASRPVIRGLAGPRVQVLTNGVGQIDASALSPDHQVATDPAEAKQVEVLRGPSTLLYGGSAIGGVVNIIDERIATRLPEGGFDGRASAQASSVDDGYQFTGSASAALGQFVLTLDGLRREAEDYDVPGPVESRRLTDLEGEEPDDRETVENSAVELKAYGAGLSYVFDRGFLGASVKRTETVYGVPGHGHSEKEGGEEEEESVSIDLKQTRIDLRGEYQLGGVFERVRGSLATADYEHVEFEGAEVGTRFKSDGVEGRLELVQAKRGNLSGAIGVQGLDRTIAAEGEEAYIPTTDIREAGVFTLQRYDRGDLGFEGGLRLDTRTLETADDERDFTNLSASAGVFARPSEGVFLGLSLSRNERAPTEAELFSFGEHAATRAFEIGDAELDSEVSYSLEAAAHFEAGRFEADLHLFGARYDGFIDLRATGEQSDEGVDIFTYRQTNAEFYGVEAEAEIELFESGDRELELEFAFDYVRGSTDLGPPARIPPYSVTARLAYETGLLDTHLEVRHVGEQDRVAEFEIPTDGYTMVNLFGAIELPQAAGVKLFAEARNLTDEEAREHTSFLKDLAPLPGRNLRVGVAYRF
jgi:iron complex outermembrane receptor protein